MEKIKWVTTIILLILCIYGTAQGNKFIRKGLLSSQLTFSPSYMVSDKQSYFYLHGGLEAFISEKTSLNGETYFLLGNIGATNPAFEYNHSTFFGASWHLNKNDHDFSLGIQPGISFTKLNALKSSPIKTQGGMNPLFSAVVAYKFYFFRFFHFFIQSRFILGQHNYDVPRDIFELRFSAGLGLNINTMKAE